MKKGVPLALRLGGFRREVNPSTLGLLCNLGKSRGCKSILQICDAYPLRHSSRSMDECVQLALRIGGLRRESSVATPPRRRQALPRERTEDGAPPPRHRWRPESMAATPAVERGQYPVDYPRTFSYRDLFSVFPYRSICTVEYGVSIEVLNVAELIRPPANFHKE